MGQGFKLSLSLYDTTDPDKDILIEKHLEDIGMARRNTETCNYMNNYQ